MSTYYYYIAKLPVSYCCTHELSENYRTGLYQSISLPEHHFSCWPLWESHFEKELMRCRLRLCPQHRSRNIRFRNVLSAIRSGPDQYKINRENSIGSTVVLL